MRELHKAVYEKDGWYFYFLNRDGVVNRCGPERTPALLQRMIDGRRKCEACNAAYCYADPTMYANPDGDCYLCVLCTVEYVEWHKNHEGAPPEKLKRNQ